MPDLGQSIRSARPLPWVLLRTYGWLHGQARTWQCHIAFGRNHINLAWCRREPGHKARIDG